MESVFVFAVICLYIIISYILIGLKTIKEIDDMSRDSQFDVKESRIEHDITYLLIGFLFAPLTLLINLLYIIIDIYAKD